MVGRCPICYRRSDDLHRVLGRCPTSDAPAIKKRKPLPPSRQNRIPRAEYLTARRSPCGTRRKYQNGCRCQPCRDAANAYARTIKARRRAD